MKIIKEKRKFSKLSVKDLSKFEQNDYVILFYGWNQYTWGVTGINYTSEIYLNNTDAPFKSKEEATIARDKEGLKSSQKLGKDEGYGPVGGYRYTVAIVKLKKLFEMISENSGRYTNHGFPSIYSSVFYVE